jgi:hypothetical protein
VLIVAGVRSGRLPIGIASAHNVEYCSRRRSSEERSSEFLGPRSSAGRVDHLRDQGTRDQELEIGQGGALKPISTRRRGPGTGGATRTEHVEPLATWIPGVE